MRLAPGRADNVAPVHILLATDADWIVDEVTAALGGPDTSFTVCRDGRAVAGAVRERQPDLAVLDLQVGSMGGMATAMALRLDESGGLLPHVAILMLLDRQADVYLAQRCGAEGWLIKPLDALRLQRAASASAAGQEYREGMPVPATEPDADPAADVAAEGELGATAEEEPAPAG